MRIGTTEDLFISDAAKAVYELWLSLPREEGELCPKRLELDLNVLPPNIRKYCFILSYLDEGVLSVVKAGTAISDFLGSKIEGQNVMAQRPPDQLPLEYRYYGAIVSQPCAGKVVRRTKNITGNHAHFNTIHLPLLDYQNKALYLLGVVAVTDREAPEEKDSENIYSASLLINQMIIDIGGGLPLFLTTKY